MSLNDPDETLTVVNKLRVQLATYRRAHQGRGPSRIEVHPSLYRLVVNAADASRSEATGPTFEGVPVTLGSGTESPFALID